MIDNMFRRLSDYQGLATIIGVIFTLGVLYGDLNKAKSDIVKLEAVDLKQDSKIEILQSNLAILTKTQEQNKAWQDESRILFKEEMRRFNDSLNTLNNNVLRNSIAFEQYKDSVKD